MIRGSWKAAWRYIGRKRCFLRSRWEANYARYLEYQRSVGEILDWEHEPKTFLFPNPDCKYAAYVPDFRVTTKDESIEYHEVKGWMDAPSRGKIEQMKEFYPDVVLLVIDKDVYRSLEEKRGIEEAKHADFEAMVKMITNRQTQDATVLLGAFAEAPWTYIRNQ